MRVIDAAWWASHTAFMAIRVLGPLETGTEHALSPRERAVLAALIVRVGRTVAPGELAEACWGDDPPRTWPQQVKTSVARIRAGLGTTAVLTRGSAYALGIDPATVDAFEFERLVSSARQHALHDENDRAVEMYRRGLALWRGVAYVELVDWEPAAVEAERLAAIRDSAEEELLESRLAEGEHRAVIADAERLVRAAPLREERWAVLAIANYRAGRQAEALATVRAARARLVDELGIDIGARLRELEASMLRQDPALTLVRTLHRVSDACPYRGLAPYSPADVDAFFGRDDDVDDIQERVRPGSLTAVVGASGSGKSSLVLAGVLPRLTSGRTVVVLTAGRDAALDLRARIEQRGAADIVVIDQAEAVFQLAERERDELCAIVADVLAAGSAVLMTLRSEFLDRATGLPYVGTAIGRGVLAIGPLTADGLRRAIECPAVGAGLRLEPGLVEVIERDAGDRRTTLPHVSHALVETWVRREGATLTVAGYEASGGIAGAIAQSAESLYRSLDAHDASACRSLMLRLVHRGADGVSVRRTASLAPLAADPARRRVIDRLVAVRLLTTDADDITVAHEAIATAWPRLDGWLENDAEGARLVGTVATAAELWHGSGRRSEDLMRGARLQGALDWRADSEPDLTAVEQEFLDTSSDRERDEVRELADRAARDRRNIRGLRWTIGGACVLLVAALLGGGLAAVRGAEAAAAAENARVEALVATSLSVRANDRETAALLAAEAFRRWPEDPRVRSALRGVMMSTGGLVDTHLAEATYQPAMDVIPGSATAVRVSSEAEGSDQATMHVIDLDTGEVRDPVELDLPAAVPFATRTVVVSPDGSTVAIQSPAYPGPSDHTGCCWSHVAFVDLRTGRLSRATVMVQAQLSSRPVFDETGRILYFAHPLIGDLIAIDSVTGEIHASNPAALDEQPTPEDRDLGLTIVDERSVAVAAGDEILIYDRATLTVTRTIPLDGDMAGSAVISDGQGGVVATGVDGTVRVSLATGETLWRRTADPTRNCNTLHLVAQSSVACGSFAGAALIDLETGETRREQTALQLNLSPEFETIDDESLLVTVDTFSMWMRWRVDGGGAGADVVAKGRELVDGPEAGGSVVVTQPVGGGRMQLWDLKRDAPVGEEADLIVPLGSGVVARSDGTGRPSLQRLAGEEIPLTVPDLPESFHLVPGGWAHLAFAWWADAVVAFDPSTGAPLGPAMNLPGVQFVDVLSASETPDQQRAVITWWEESIGSTETAVFDISTGDLLVRGLHGLEQSHALDSDQVIGIEAENARRYDIRTLEPISSLARAIGGSQLISASSDGRTLLSVGFNNALTLYDLRADVALAAPLDSDAPGVRLRGGYLTADGETLLEALPDGIRIWDLRPVEQALDACALAGRELSEEEWSTYFPDEERVDTCAALTS